MVQIWAKPGIRFQKRWIWAGERVSFFLFSKEQLISSQV